MSEPKDTAYSNDFKGFTNDKCPFMPCSKGVNREFNCLFCYCPLYFVECPGPYEVFTDKYGDKRKDCTNCTLPHDGYEQSWNFIQKWLEYRPIPWRGCPQSKENILVLNQRRTLHPRMTLKANARRARENGHND